MNSIPTQDAAQTVAQSGTASFDFGTLLIGFFLGVLFCGFLALVFFILAPWLKAFTSGARVGLIQILGMRFRGSPPGLLVDALAMLVQRGRSDIRMSNVEHVYIAQKHQVSSAHSLVELVEKEYPGKG